jgi:phosphoheptose isomerase
LRNQKSSTDAETWEAAAELHDVLRRFLETRSGIFKAAAETAALKIRAGRKVLIFGNGGSAAEAGSEYF